MPGTHAQKLWLRVALVCYSNIHKGSEASIRKCQIAELLALAHHRGELKCGVGLQSTGNHMVAEHTAWFQAKCLLLYGVVCHLSSGIHCLQRVEETLRKDTNLFKQIKAKYPSASGHSSSKKHLLGTSPKGLLTATTTLRPCNSYLKCFH